MLLSVGALRAAVKLTAPEVAPTIDRVKVYGLTGGIGSGKSTVARMLRDRGIEVVDADQIAREVVVPGSRGLQLLVEAFGARILDGDALDRKALGTLVFADASARARLNAIVHPLIAEETKRRMQAIEGTPFAFYEAALLVENASHLAMDGLVVVEATPAVQRERVAARDALDAAEIDRRIAAQTSDEARRALADVVLVNTGTLAALEAQVDALIERLANAPLRR